MLVTFLIWFLSWNTLETIFIYYNISVSDKLKLCFIGASAVWYYYYENYNKDDKDCNE